MARETKVDEVEKQIKKRQEKLFQLKAQSDTVAEEIEVLLKEKKDAQKEAILAALDKSDRWLKEPRNNQIYVMLKIKALDSRGNSE